MNSGLMKKPVKAPVDLGEPRIDRGAIGMRLRELFDAVVNEPVPDDFLDLLRQADERQDKGVSHPERSDD
jgi:hypothetical protein